MQYTFVMSRQDILIVYCMFGRIPVLPIEMDFSICNLLSLNIHNLAR